MAKIIIVGSGPVEDGLLTVQAMNVLKTAKLVLLKTPDHPITSFLAREKIVFDSLENIAAEAADLEEPDERICQKLVSLAGEHKEVIVAIPGHPLVGQSMISKLVERCQSSGVAIEVIAPPCSARASFERLVEVMAKLRSPDGCPWDREQTHSSLKRYLIEESHEVIEAIDTRNGEHLKEELGDLLLQIVFHAQIADESGDFDIHDVLEGIVRKLIGRHPHIFGDKEAETPEDVVAHWEEAKRKEGKTRVLSGIPPSLPALLYALKLQKKAARVGFDWEEKEDVIDKLFEEVEELKEAFTQGEGRKELEEEIGDILFSVVNIARHFGIEPEDALGRTLKKFRRRFEYIENEAEKKNTLLIDMSLEEKEMLWQEAKKSERD